MRIVHVVPTYYPAVRYGGPIWSVHALCKKLAQRGHDVRVLTTNVDGSGNLDVPLGTPVNLDGVTVTYFPSVLLRRLYWSPGMNAQLPNLIAGSDFVHLHSVFLAPTSAAARTAEGLDIPWCVSPRGALVPEMIQRRSTLVKRFWIWLNERRTLERASFIHATSVLEAEDARRMGLHLPRIRVIPNGVDVPEAPSAGAIIAINPASVHVGSQPYLLFLGRIHWKKGLDRLIPAMAAVPGGQLVIAGNDEEGLTPRLQQLARQAGVTGRIHFIGPVAGAEKQALLQGASLLVLPSYSENFGNVLLESLAQGRPVAMTSEVGLAPAIHAANAGQVVSAAPGAMGGQLAALMADPDNLNAMGARGRQLVRSRYAWEPVAAEMEQSYLDAIRAKRVLPA